MLAGSISSLPMRCYGPEGLLRRQGYTVDIVGGATGLNCAPDYRDVNGIMVPAKRRLA
jgi:hypothetical protein